MGWQNLDLECAIKAREIAKSLEGQDAEKLCTDAAAVLAENGPYALFLYLWSRRDKQPTGAQQILDGAYQFLGDKLAPGTAPRKGDIDTIMTWVADLGKDLNRLLLAKRLLMQTLTYLRYATKGSRHKTRKHGSRP